MRISDERCGGVILREHVCFVGVARVCDACYDFQGSLGLLKSRARD